VRGFHLSLPMAYQMAEPLTFSNVSAVLNDLRARCEALVKPDPASARLLQLSQGRRSGLDIKEPPVCVCPAASREMARERSRFISQVRALRERELAVAGTELSH
jgi:hypothetical protein